MAVAESVDRSAVATSSRAGIYVAVLQLALTLSWTAYVIYLPKMAASVGIAPAAVILILMLDQAIFTITDTAMGLMADKVATIVGKLGTIVAVLTLISCAAFIALPYVAAIGSSASTAFIALVVVWAITSSALRAPPLMLLGKYGARPKLPYLAAFVMLGYGVAGALAPYLGVLLRDVDVRLPFVLSSVVLIVVAMTLSRIERGLIAVAPRSTASVAPSMRKPTPLVALVIASTLVVALGYQLHFNINSSAYFLRFATAADLQWLLPIFWIGFNIALFPAGVLTLRRGALIVMAAAGLVGAIAIIAAEYAGGLHSLIVSQFLAGAAWGCMLTSAFSAGLTLGDRRTSGRITGLVFSALALATFARMAVIAGGLPKLPEYSSLLRWAPIACWLVVGSGLLLILGFAKTPVHESNGQSA